MELRHLRYFIAIAEEGGINRAASRLRVAQPALSRQLHDLELELGGPLCERHAAGISLTPSGELLLRRARALLNDVARTTQEVRALAGQVDEHLTVGFLGNPHLEYLRPALTALTSANPRLRLEFFQGMCSEQLAAVREGRIDVAFVNLPAVLDGLEHAHVRRMPLVIVLPDDHRLLRRKKLKLADLEGEPFVFCTRESRPEFYDFVHHQFTSRQIRLHTVREVGGSLDVVVGLVKLGIGLSVLPYYPGAEKAYTVEWRRFTRPEPHLQFALAWRPETQSPRINELCALLQERQAEEERAGQFGIVDRWRAALREEAPLAPGTGERAQGEGRSPSRPLTFSGHAG